MPDCTGCIALALPSQTRRRLNSRAGPVHTRADAAMRHESTHGQVRLCRTRQSSRAGDLPGFLVPVRVRVRHHSSGARCACGGGLLPRPSPRRTRRWWTERLHFTDSHTGWTDESDPVTRIPAGQLGQAADVHESMMKAKVPECGNTAALAPPGSIRESQRRMASSWAGSGSDTSDHAHPKARGDSSRYWQFHNQPRSPI